jgi:hypothetical protein
MKMKFFLLHGESQVKQFFLGHRLLSYAIAFFFIYCCLHVDYSVINNARTKMKKLEYKEGVISSWDIIGTSFFTAEFKIENDKRTYETTRYTPWSCCLQHTGEKGEKVSFYILRNKKNHNGTFSYYGLSKIGNPRSQFWLFFDVLLSCYKSVFIWWGLGLFGCVMFNFQIIRKRMLLLLTGLIWGISLLLYAIANIS